MTNAKADALWYFEISMVLFVFPTVHEQEYTCPLCAGGFIEELPPNGTHERSRSTSSNDDVEIGEYDNHRLNERISSLLMSSIGGGLRVDDDSESSNQDGSSASKWFTSIFDRHCINVIHSRRWPTKTWQRTTCARDAKFWKHHARISYIDFGEFIVYVAICCN